MLRHGMEESRTKRIRLPDKAVFEWQVFYAFLEPVAGRRKQITVPLRCLPRLELHLKISNIFHHRHVSKSIVYIDGVKNKSMRKLVSRLFD